MPSPRRKRYALFAIALTILTILYLTTGAQSTQSSPFYSKTVARMEAKKQELLVERKVPGMGATAEAGKSDRGASEGAEDAEDATGKLKERLKLAEVAAKKSADDKWKNVAGVADRVEDGRSGRQRKGKLEKAAAAAAVKADAPAVANKDSVDGATNERGIAGRKKYPAPADQGASAEDGIAHVGPHVDGAPAPLGANNGARSDGEAEEEEAVIDTVALAKQELTRLLTLSPIMIFSKSYCPHSAKAKRILLQYHTITPTPHVVELDQHDLTRELQDQLLQMTGRRTVPNVLVAGQSIGGGDDMQAIWEKGEMEKVLKKVGGKAVKKVVVNRKVDDEDD